jgi:hypothetical protein
MRQHLRAFTWVVVLILPLLLLVAPASRAGGKTVRDLNGLTLDCDVEHNGRTYDLEVDFEGDEAVIHFKNGGKKTVDIDNPESTELSSIECTDRSGSSWTLSVQSPPAGDDGDDD